MQEKTLHVVFGNQLFPIDQIHRIYEAKAKPLFFMAETQELCSYFRFHKHKLILFLASMRSYRDMLRKNGFEVIYTELTSDSYEQILGRQIQKTGCKILATWEVEDHFMEDRLQNLAKAQDIELRIHISPMFVHTRLHFKNYLESVKKPFMKTFYERSRKQLNILMDTSGKPLGGRFSFDDENRKRLPKAIEIPNRLHLQPKAANQSNHVRDVSQIINQTFPSHPGETADFWLPTTRSGWMKHLIEFTDQYFTRFGDYEDAISTRDPFLFHSVLSPGLNLGLITPDDVIQTALTAFRENQNSSLRIPLNSVEGFIRQILGWREFIRGIYHHYDEHQRTSNFWNHNRPLTQKWYTGSTGIPPVDDAIKKALKFGYNHHIERLMILSNTMLLAEIKPQLVHRWFMEMYVDSSDWVMGPNVYGMGQFSDGGVFATKPYICGSNYILKMSDYKKGDWCEVLDSLYWTFILKHRSFYEKNPRMSVMVKALDKIKPDRLSRMMLLAENFRKT